MSVPETSSMGQGFFSFFWGRGFWPCFIYCCVCPRSLEWHGAHRRNLINIRGRGRGRRETDRERGAEERIEGEKLEGARQTDKKLLWNSENEITEIQLRASMGAILLTMTPIAKNQMERNTQSRIPFTFNSKQAKLIFRYRHQSKNWKEHNTGVINTKADADVMALPRALPRAQGGPDTCWSTACLQLDCEFTRHYYCPSFIRVVSMLTSFIINMKTASHLSQLPGEKVQPDERGLQQRGMRSWTQEQAWVREQQVVVSRQPCVGLQASSQSGKGPGLQWSLDLYVFKPVVRVREASSIIVYPILTKKSHPASELGRWKTSRKYFMRYY